MHLLIVTLMTLQAEDASAVLKRIENRFVNAQTLKFTFDYGYQENRREVRGDCGARRPGCWGTLWAKGDQLLLDEWRCAQKREVRTLTFYKRGTVTSFSYVHRPQEDPPPPPEIVVTSIKEIPLRVNGPLRLAIARAGLDLFDGFLQRYSVSPKDGFPDIDAYYEVKDARFGPNEKGWGTLIYTLKYPIQKEIQTDVVTLSYDPKTFLPRKRIVDNGVYKSYEDYEGVEVDMEIPDSTFDFAEASRK